MFQIPELIATERQYFLNLKIMQRVFANGMITECGLPESAVQRIFPHLEKLIEIHQTFLTALTARQDRKPDRSVDQIGKFHSLIHVIEGVSRSISLQPVLSVIIPMTYVVLFIGDLIMAQFGGDMGERMKACYGKFCSQHKEGVDFYKHLLKADRKFQAFIKVGDRIVLTSLLPTVNHPSD